MGFMGCWGTEAFSGSVPITSKQRRKVKTFFKNEMFMMEANIDISEPAPTAGVKSGTQTSRTPQSRNSGQTSDFTD